MYWFGKFVYVYYKFLFTDEGAVSLSGLLRIELPLGYQDTVTQAFLKEFLEPIKETINFSNCFLAWPWVCQRNRRNQENKNEHCEGRSII